MHGYWKRERGGRGEKKRMVGACHIFQVIEIWAARAFNETMINVKMKSKFVSFG